jgi:hypothetical protein
VTNFHAELQHRGYGFRACASGRQLPTDGASRNDER